MASRPGAPRAVLLDLLMATMNSIDTWAEAAGGRAPGLFWRDAVSARMIEAGRYGSYDRLVRGEAARQGLPADAHDRLLRAWAAMRPWPDTAGLGGLDVPYAFVTNCSRRLADAAAAASGLQPAFTLSAEEAGWYKPRPEIYVAACRRLGMPPADVRYLAGAAYDAAGAAAVGLDAFLVARRPASRGVPAGVSIARTMGEALSGLAPRP